MQVMMRAIKVKDWALEAAILATVRAMALRSAQAFFLEGSTHAAIFLCLREDAQRALVRRSRSSLQSPLKGGRSIVRLRGARLMLQQPRSSVVLSLKKFDSILLGLRMVKQLHPGTDTELIFVRDKAKTAATLFCRVNGCIAYARGGVENKDGI